MKFNFFKKLKYTRTNTVFMVLGILFTLYFCVASVIWGSIDIFNMIMIFFGLLWIMVSVKIDKICIVYRKLPKVIKFFLKAALFSFILSFIFVEGIILYNMRTTASSGADYVIVLGCRVNGSMPSTPLIRRVNTAVKYLNNNQNTNIVISGGQGFAEDISEAEAMNRLLIQNGISEERIFIENNSKSTKENLKFSDNLYNLHDKHIVMVSTDFHIFRALSTAKKLNYKNIETLPSKSQLSVLPTYLLREYTAIMYYKLSGKI